ncbi:unnamed protein product [Effrenium voratum]|nr:unnamed protein product [Effrenium voratum]
MASPRPRRMRMCLALTLAACGFGGFGFCGFAWDLRASKIGRRGWADPGWNWGSASGTAHDEAMALRSRLRSKVQRQTWLDRLEEGELDAEELKLALGLRIQHAARANADGNGRGWQLMQDMAAVKYEGPDGPQLLKEDLDQLADALRVPHGRDLGQSGSLVLVAMDFLEEGL